jgi:hypothetical protein
VSPPDGKSTKDEMQVNGRGNREGDRRKIRRNESARSEDGGGKLNERWGTKDDAKIEKKAVVANLSGGLWRLDCYEP